jgi:hypothetical protein
VVASKQQRNHADGILMMQAPLSQPLRGSITNPVRGTLLGTD